MSTNGQLQAPADASAPLSHDELVAVIGNAPPWPRWPIYAWGIIWVAWLLFLLFMVVQR